jgi:hypothetical protein
VATTADLIGEENCTCASLTTAVACVDQGCIFEGGVCRNGPYTGTPKCINSMLAANLGSVANYRNSWRVTITGVELPATPGDQGAYTFTFDATSVSPTAPARYLSQTHNQNTENHLNNPDIVEGIDCVDITPSEDAVCTTNRTVTLKLEFVNFMYPRMAGPNRNKHQLVIKFPELEKSYDYLGMAGSRGKAQFEPLLNNRAPHVCGDATEVDWNIPITFLGTAAQDSTCRSTTNLELNSNWFAAENEAAKKKLQTYTMTSVNGAATEVTRYNTITARWVPEKRWVVIETHADLPRGRLVFTLGDTFGSGFVIGSPLSGNDLSGRSLANIGPSSGIVRGPSQYTVQVNRRPDDLRDLSSYLQNDPIRTTSTLQSALGELQCTVTTNVETVVATPAHDQIRSGVCDFDVVPSQCAPSAQNVWLTFSFTVDQPANEIDIAFPPASFTRDPEEKCGTTTVPVELLAVWQQGTAAAIDGIVTTATWDHDNQYLTTARTLKLKFSQALPRGYLVLRAGGFVNPPRVGDPSRPTSGPNANNAAVDYPSYYRGGANDLKYSVTLRSVVAAQATQTWTRARTQVQDRGSVNARSDWIGCLYCGADGVALPNGVRRTAAFDVDPSAQSIHGGAWQRSVSLEVSLCVRRDIPAGSRIVVRLPQNSYTMPDTPTDEVLVDTRDVMTAPGLVAAQAKGYLDRTRLATSYDYAFSTTTPAGTCANPLGATNYGQHSFQPLFRSQQLREHGNDLPDQMPQNDDAPADAARTVTVIVGEDGVAGPERPARYMTSADNTMTATTQDPDATRGPTGVRIVTFYLSYFVAPCSLDTHSRALGTYGSQTLAPGDLGEYDVRVEFTKLSLKQLWLQKRDSPRLVPQYVGATQYVPGMPGPLCGTTTAPAWLEPFTYNRGSGFDTDNIAFAMLRNDMTNTLYPEVEVLLKAAAQYGHPDVAQCSAAGSQNFAASPSNPPSDQLVGLTDYYWHFEILAPTPLTVYPNGRRVLNWKLSAPGRKDVCLDIKFELPSCFVSREKNTG